MMPRFRQHRGTLSAALETTVEVADVAALVAHVRTLLCFETVTASELRFAPYGGNDDRIGWKDVHIVSVPGGVVGFVEGAVLKDDNEAPSVLSQAERAYFNAITTEDQLYAFVTYRVTDPWKWGWTKWGGPRAWEEIERLSR